MGAEVAGKYHVFSFFNDLTHLTHISEVFFLFIVKIYSTKSLSFALASIVSYIQLVINLGAQTWVAGDNRVTREKKKGALRWHEVVGGCDDLEQVPGGSKMEMMLP